MRGLELLRLPGGRAALVLDGEGARTLGASLDAADRWLRRDGGRLPRSLVQVRDELLGPVLAVDDGRVVAVGDAARLLGVTPRQVRRLAGVRAAGRGLVVAADVWEEAQRRAASDIRTSAGRRVGPGPGPSARAG